LGHSQLYDYKSYTKTMSNTNGRVVRWRIDETTGDKRVVYYYSSIWNGRCDDIMGKHFGHLNFVVRKAGHIDEHGRLADVPEADKGQFLIDVAPARETRK